MISIKKLSRKINWLWGSISNVSLKIIIKRFGVSNKFWNSILKLEFQTYSWVFMSQQNSPIGESETIKRNLKISHLTVTLPFGTPVPKASKMHFSGTSQPWMPKMFQGTPTKIERRIWCWYKKNSWVKFLISCKPEVNHKSLVLPTYLMVSYIQEYSRIIGYDKTYG